MKNNQEFSLLKKLIESLEKRNVILEDIIQELEVINKIQEEHIKELEIKLKGAKKR
jgi:hypothetical protein